MIGLILIAIKQVAAFLLYRSGLLHLWIRWKFGNRALVVMYHRVLDSGTDLSQSGTVVQTNTFEKQLLQLRGMFSMVPLSDAIHHEGGGFRCAITFDDGWADNHRFAFPVLKRLGLPATLFITTGYIGTQRLFWPECLAYILQRHDEQVDALIESLKNVPEQTREDFLDQQARLHNRPLLPSETRMLSWDQVRDLKKQGFDIGSHTVNHVLLNHATPELVEKELGESRDQITTQLWEPPQSFAYPNGNWNPVLAESVRKAGYSYAVTTESPWKIPENTNPVFAIPRKNLCEGSSNGLFGFSASIFACEAVGFFDWCRRP